MARNAFLPSILLAATLALAGCGSSASTAVKLEQAVTKMTGAAKVRCAPRKTLAVAGRQARVYACSFSVEQSVHAMRVEDRCFVYVGGKAVDVTRRLLGTRDCGTS